MNLVFYLFTRHHWTPEMYYGMGHGGRDLTWGMALLEMDMDEERRDNRGG